MENEEIITRVRSVMLCLTAHPHYEEGSELLNISKSANL